ncbi:MAG: hypothetical protein N2C12_11115 [Planctomycetales bacterium]
MHLLFRRLTGAAMTFGRHTRTLVLFPVMATLVAGGIYLGWQVLRQSDEYLVSPKDIELAPPPRWVDRDVLLGEIVRDASLDDRLSLLDDRLTERINMAFRAHPWVESAEAEKFHPARIKVQIVYREPVAVVSSNDQLIPIDKNGIRLPAEDFTLDELRQFARLDLLSISHQVRDGEIWDDPRILGGATIAAAIGEEWLPFGLAAIQPAAQPIVDHPQAYTYMLVTRSGARIPWGPQFLKAHATEPTAEEKMDRLKAYVKKNGPLDRVPATGAGVRNTRKQ